MHHSERENTENLLDFDIRKTQKKRLKNQELNQALFGLIAYFEDSQIRDRQGKFSSLYHYSEASIPSKSRITIWRQKSLSGLSLPIFLRVRNREGEWASQLHAMPEFPLTGNKKKARLSVQDSNMYVTGFCTLALQSLSEAHLDKDDRVLEGMIDHGFTCIRGYQQGDGYNFWPLQEAVFGNIKRRGPLNIWIEITAKALALLLRPRVKSWFKRSSRSLELPSMTWLDACLNDPKNSQGADALFNICNDTEDTALALILEYARAGKITPEMQKSIQAIESFRDINRENVTGNAFERWKGKNTGAYLTWLKEEDPDFFKNPDKGLIPGGVNNVDAVVNANILYAFSVLGERQAQGYQECITLLCKAVEGKTWPGSGLYYPQQMMFPYAFSRAIRDGGIKDPQIVKAQQKLMLDVLKLAKQHKKGYFFEGGKDKSTHMSTALGLLSLLNMGESVAQKVGKLTMFQTVVEGCIDYLLQTAQYRSSLFKSTREKFAITGSLKFIPQWEDGLFFGPVHWDLCHWRSQSVTHACILEAFNKYLLAYDRGANLDQRNRYQLCIESYDVKNLQDDKWIRIIQGV